MVQIRHQSQNNRMLNQRIDWLSQLITESVPDWYSRAACGTADPTIFWADEYQTDPNKEKVSGGWDDAAKAVCATCPVARECELYVRENNVRDHAVWAGKQRKASNTGTPFPDSKYARAGGYSSGAEDDRHGAPGTPLLPDPRVVAEIDELLARRDELLARVRGDHP